MRSLWGTLVVVLLVVGGCSDGSDEPEATPTPSADATTATRAVTLESLDLDWPRSDGTLDAAKPPAVPDGFDEGVYDQMVTGLKAWAAASTVDDTVWHNAKPVEQVASTLPGQAAATLTKQSEGQASPRLAVANVFSDRVKVIGEPQVSTAWQVRTVDDDTEKPYIVLEAETRAAYEVRLGANGPSRVIGMLRVHALSAFDDTTDDFGVSGGWQEFGAGDCSLALNDSLIPDADVDGSAKDLEKFIAVGNDDAVVMPDLGDDEQVDGNYLKRCREGSI
ncbi:hypothetical protein [Aeromicrobium sp. UC242_57]|uniref:hypothetical protein n=1 Tax=Aeromicrobium sp. UC242_57 TaxID=3374624 RepID=UPI0037AE646C